MKNIKNNVQLIGNLGKDVELITFDSGNKKAVLTLATNERYKNNKGEKVEETHWHNIVAWGNLADNMAEVLSKGMEVVINGKLANRSYETKDGQKRYITEVIAREFLKVTKKEAVPF